MQTQSKSEEMQALLQKAMEYNVQLKHKPITLASIVCSHISNKTEFEQEIVIGTGIDTTQLRLDVTKTQVIFTLEDADTVIDSVAFDIQESKEDSPS